MTDFRSDVLDRSDHVPVLVDFWAPWCQPCRVLGPVLEELASESAGRWELVQLNTEEQPELAAEYGIRSIPAVKLFHQGIVIGEFVGALPRAEVQRWLEEVLPDPRIDRLREIAGRWKAHGPEVVPELEAFAGEHPDIPEGRLRLALAIVPRDPARAREIARTTRPSVDVADLPEDVESLADLVECRDAPERVASHFEAARQALERHDLEATLEHLVDAAMRNKDFGDQLARRAAVALFRLLGRDDERTQKYERQLSMAILS